MPGEYAVKLCCGIVNRGVAVWKGKVIWGTLDGRLIAVDAKTGEKVWEIQATDPKKWLSITGAPRIADGRIFIGEAGSEFEERGYLAAYSADTGKELWRWWSVPGDPSKGFEQPELAMAAKTWSGEWWKTGGGGTPWDGITYDPDHRLCLYRHRQWRALAVGGPLAGRWRQPVHRLGRRGGCQDRQVRLALPGDSGGELRLRQHRADHDGGPRHQWREAARGDACPEERRVLRARCAHRQVHLRPYRTCRPSTG